MMAGMIVVLTVCACVVLCLHHQFPAEIVFVHKRYSTNDEVAIAKADLMTIENALEAFRATYGRWPCQSDGQTTQVFRGDAQRKIIRTLNGSDKSINTNGIIFLLSSSGTVVDLFRDPWGKPYAISFSTDPNTQIVNSAVLDAGRGKASVWSESPLGPKSWQR